MSGVADTSVKAGVRKALDISISTYLVKSHAEFGVVSCWSVGTRTFCSFLGRVHSHVGGRGSDVLSAL